ncbi:MAG: SMC-Scp complex subunit ScpB [Candidatus Bathyarchaeota archaeon]|nr:SMC-Scp complex subunit ScpB [Candidatus Termiticorpusculum sp.]MCL2867836.1 SMC-Scp complex subunit ScpB [Candidatus Termiticorpusculum sp.]
MEKQNNNSIETQTDVAEQPLPNQVTEEEQQTISADQSITTIVETESTADQTSPDPIDQNDVEDKEADAVHAAEKLKHNLALIEAALYVAGKPLDINVLCQVVGSRSKKRVKKYVDFVIKGYADRDSPLEILALKDERYVLQVKAEFTPLIKKLVDRPLLSSGPLKTLSYIAFRQPITQKRVIEVRGQHAYGHVKLLKDMGLIMSDRVGRSMALKTTDYFADYFGLTQDTSAMKRELRRIFGDVAKEVEQT